MIQSNVYSQEDLPEKNKVNQEGLIVFDSQIEDIQQFHSEYSSQICKEGSSVISDETEKRKKEAKLKFEEYLKDRQSLGFGPVKKTQYNEQQDLEGALIDELDVIQGKQLFKNQIEAFIIKFNKKPEQAIAWIIQQGKIQNNPEQIAAYLIKMPGLDKTVLGEYFGKNKPEIMKIFHQYCLKLNFHKIQFDTAIRQLLSKFLLPGEAQQIQRIIWQFAQAFYQSNTQDYDNADQLFPLAYAIIMLSTDAHNPKQQKKMTKDQFINNTKGACPSIPAGYLSSIYDRITSEKFETEVTYMEQIYPRIKDLQFLEINKLNELRNRLMEGDVFLKVCRTSNKFVQRKVYITTDEKRIQWVNDPPGFLQEDPRFIEIKDITDLTLGLSSNVMKKNKVPKEFDSLCFTIETRYRTLDLKAKTNKIRTDWVNYLRTFLITRRKQEEKEADQIHRSISRESIEEVWNTDIFQHWDRHWDYIRKKPKQKNAIERSLQAICCCFSAQKSKTSDMIELQGRLEGLRIKNSLLDTLWKLGLPKNSRKTLWPLVIGNNLAYTSSMIQQLNRRMKILHEAPNDQIFSHEAQKIANITLTMRTDIPPIKELFVLSSVFLQGFPKNSNSSHIINFINLIHMHHFLAFYRGDKTQIDLRIQLFDFLLQKNLPKVKQHFEGLQLETRMYLVNWFLSLFTIFFIDEKNQDIDARTEKEYDYDFILRIWDNFLLEGEIYLFKVGITIVKYYSIELKMCTFQDGLKILRQQKGTSQALFFDLLETVDVREEYYLQYVEKRKHAIIKTKVQSIPLQ